MSRQPPQAGCEESNELRFVHLSGSHRKFAMVDGAVSGDIAFDRYVIRWINKHDIGAPRSHQCPIAILLEGIAAKDPMLP